MGSVVRVVAFSVVTFPKQRKTWLAWAFGWGVAEVTLTVSITNTHSNTSKLIGYYSSYQLTFSLLTTLILRLQSIAYFAAN